MPRPIAPIIFIAIFLAVVIAAVLMFAIVLANNEPPPASTPKAAIALQLALLKEGDAVALRLTVLEPLRAQVTPELVKTMKPAFQAVTIDDLVREIRIEDLETGGQVATVVEGNGKVLTRLVLVDENWLADSVWFR